MPPRSRPDDKELLRPLGKSIQTAREKAGLTQEKLAEAIGITPRSVQKYEAGVIKPQLTMIIRIQRALRCSWNELLGAPER